MMAENRQKSSGVQRFLNFYLSLVGLPLINGSAGFIVMWIQSQSIEIALFFVPFMAIPSAISAFIIRYATKPKEANRA